VRKRYMLAAALIAACQFAAIAAATEPNDQMVRKTYQVADLVIPQGSANAGEKAKPVTTTEDRLINQIVENVSPLSWDKHGGPGTIQYFAPTMSIVVNQDVGIQEQVAGLLARLRKEQDTQVSVEVRLVTITDDVYARLGEAYKLPPRILWNKNVTDDAGERIGVDFEPKVAGKVKSSQHKGTTFLSEADLSKFLEQAANDVHTNVMTAPKITVIAGQKASFTAGEGIRNHLHSPATADFYLHFGVKPEVSADQRFVKLALKLEDLGETEPIHKTVVVPNGRTVVLGGYRAPCQKIHEEAPPVISEIPYLNRLFINERIDPESRRVLVLVTPRIIVAQEEQVEVKPVAAVVYQPQSAPRALATEIEKPARQVNVLAELLQAYDSACAEGRGDEAEKLARAALILDPTCFHRSK
jgi:type II secretory pathway component GspD/PulD (secretin)